MLTNICDYVHVCTYIYVYIYAYVRECCICTLWLCKWLFRSTATSAFTNSTDLHNRLTLHYIILHYITLSLHYYIIESGRTIHYFTYLDFKDAFDFVTPKQILPKLYSYWFSNSLSECTVIQYWYILMLLRMMLHLHCMTSAVLSPNETILDKSFFYCIWTTYVKLWHKIYIWHKYLPPYDFTRRHRYSAKWYWLLAKFVCQMVPEDSSSQI